MLLIMIYTKTSDNHIVDLIQSISMININIEGVKTISRDNITYELSCYVTGIEQLDKLILAIKKNSFVEKVERAFRWEY